ncbi:MAG: MFS transporter [Pseudomonadota bacterium]
MIKFITENLRWLGAGFLLTFFSGIGQTFFISLSNDAFREKFNLSHGELAGIYSAATLASALILLEFGKIVDRRSVRFSALVVVGGAALAAFWMSMAWAAWTLFFGYLGLRLFGQGLMSHVSMTAIGRWFDAYRGRAVSLAILGYPVSEALLPPLAVAGIATFGVPALWAFGGAVVLFVAGPVLFGLLSEERTPQTAASHEVVAEKRSWRRREVLREPSFYLLLVGVLCPGFMATCLFFHQLHLVEVKGWSVATFALAFSVFAIAQVGASLLTGGAIDRYSARALLPIYLIPLGLGLILAWAVDGEWAVFVVLALVGVTAGIGSALIGALWPELYGIAFLGEIRALAFAAMVSATAASPVLTGFLIDQGVAFPAQLAAMGVFAIAASGLMAALQPRLAAIALDKGEHNTTKSSPSGDAP